LCSLFSQPTLFNYFTNDLHDIFDSTKVASLSFADDLVILSNTSEGLQNSLNKLEKYCYDWQLSENKTFSPFLLSSCVAFLKLPLKSMTLPRKLYSLVSVKRTFL
jgi:hypothetical protein